MLYQVDDGDNFCNDIDVYDGDDDYDEDGDDDMCFIS